MFIIGHTVTTGVINHKRKVITKDRTKNKASNRTLPLNPLIATKITSLQKRQEVLLEVCGDSYNKDYLDYLFVDDLGNLISSDSLSRKFNKFLGKNGLRHIRLHDLRHTCASLMIVNKMPLKYIQEWLGHSDISTTGNYYGHLEYSTKFESAAVMTKCLELDK